MKKFNYFLQLVFYYLYHVSPKTNFLKIRRTNRNIGTVREIHGYGMQC